MHYQRNVLFLHFFDKRPQPHQVKGYNVQHNEDLELLLLFHLLYKHG